MDNKITKKRLSDFLSYEWIIMILVAVVAIVVWELVYTVAAVRLTEGQKFKYYYDTGIYSGNDSAFYSLLTGDGEDATFSYDVLSVSSETLNTEYNVLNLRLSVYEGDAIFASSAEIENSNGNSRAKTIVDSESVYVLNDLLTDGVNYLARFLKDGKSVENDGNAVVFDYSNLDENKIKDNFLARMRKDNRFRSDSQKQQGIELEKGRIKKACTELKKFNYLMSIGEEKGLFFRYTRWQHSLDEANRADSGVSEEDKKACQERVNHEIAQHGENAVYGLNLEKFTGGAKQTSEYFRTVDKTTSEGMVLMLFDFYDVAAAKQVDLQLETVSFVNKIVEEFSDLYKDFGGNA